MFSFIGFLRESLCLEIAMNKMLSATMLALSLGVTVPALSHAEKVLHLNNVEEPSSLNPALGLNLISWEPLNNLMEGLVRLDEKHNAVAAAAEKWDVSEDGKTYTFHLRKNAKWSDGSPVTAGDFVYGWTQLLTPATASPAAFLLYDIVGAQDFNAGKAQAGALGIRALDDFTLQVTLNAPSLSFLSILTNPGFAPVNRKAAQANPKWHTEAATYVSNGPFLLKEWNHASNMRFEKNPNYWDKDAVKLDAVDWVMINDLNTSYQMFRTGELDATPSPLPAALYDKVKDSKEFMTLPQAGVYFYRFNTKMPPFQNADIRRAFALAVNRQDIVDYVVKQGRRAADAFVSPGFTGPDGKDFYETSHGFVKTDAAQAKALLKKGMDAEKYATLPPVTLSHINNPDDRKIAQALQAMFKENLGVDVQLQGIESKVFYTQQRGGKLQFSRSSFTNDYADPYNALESFVSHSSMNRTGWSNAEYDELIKSARTQTDAAKRWELLQKSQQVLFADMPIFPLFFYNQGFMQKTGVSGILRHPVGYIDLKTADIQ